ncbi:MAG: hypothetical protein WAS73_14775 [Defluviicoccus sp.]
MATALLRIEGVNFDASVLDTNDLSTVRGGSFLFLEAIKAICAALELKTGSAPAHPLIPRLISATPLIEGASVGLFRLELGDPQPDVEDVRRIVAGWLDGTGLPQLKNAGLAKQPHLRVLNLARYATFVVDVKPYQDDRLDKERFIEARETVIAANRWRQMQAPTVVAVTGQPVDGRGAGKRICSIDFVRPGWPRKPLKGNEKPIVSQSVYRRRGYGLRRKFNLYDDILTRVQARGGGGVNPGVYDYAGDFEELAFPREKDLPLAGKIAVFYADGNDFTKVQDEAVGDDRFGWQGEPHDRQHIFDKQLGDWRDEVFAAVVRRVAECGVGVGPPDPKDINERPRLRLETLIWAGDDGTWVVPAALGWTLAWTFFAETLGLDLVKGGPGAGNGWRFVDQDPPLHHAAGLVFCHHDAPITRIHALAKGLAGYAKAIDRKRSLLAYQVLESFDHIGHDLETFRSSRCPAGVRPPEMLIDGATMAGVAKAMAILKHEPGARLARRQVKRLALTLYESGAGGEATEIEKALLGDLSKKGRGEIEKLRSCFGRGLALWLHLDDLWDFLDLPESSPAAGGGTCVSTS